MSDVRRQCQNGTDSLLPVEPYLLRLRFHISPANSLRRSGGVACIRLTASATVILPPSPLIDETAFIQAPRVSAPADAAGLYWRVRLPNPRRLNTTPSLVLQDRQFQIRFEGAVFSSRPSRWPTSTLRLLPQRQQIRSPGGGWRLARYLKARSVTASLRHACPPARARVSPPLLPPLPLHH